MNVTWVDKASGSRRAGTGIGGAVSIGKDLSGDSKQLTRDVVSGSRSLSQDIHRM